MQGTGQGEAGFRDPDHQESQNEAPILVKNSELIKNEKALPQIPDHVEWWDHFLLPPDATTKGFPIDREISENDFFLERVTHYIQHPVPLKNAKVEELDQMVTSIYLTEKEKKRLSRNKRLEKEKDKQERIKLGLMAAPLPKIKMSNYQKVMAKDAIVDPSGTEIIAKAIVQKRLEDHLQQNEERKLDSHGKEQRMLRKHTNDKQRECRQALFRIDVDLNQQP